MLWTSTLSVFLPSLLSSSAVWAEPAAGHSATTVASNHIFFTITLPWFDACFPRCADCNTGTGAPSAPKGKGCYDHEAAICDGGIGGGRRIRLEPRARSGRGGE